MAASRYPATRSLNLLGHQNAAVHDGCVIEWFADKRLSLELGDRQSSGRSKGRKAGKGDVLPPPGVDAWVGTLVVGASIEPA